MADGGWVTLCEDVTERHRMEHELRLQYERFDQAVNHMSHGLCMFGPDERLIVCNAQYIEDVRPRSRGRQTGMSRRATCSRSGSKSVDAPEMTADEFYEKRKTRGHRQVDFDHAAESEGRARDRGRHRVRRRTAAGSRRTRTSPSGLAPRRRCASRTSCSTPRWRTWRTACACSTRNGAWSCATGAISNSMASGRTTRSPERR